jgi:ribosomal protein L28
VPSPSNSPAGYGYSTGMCAASGPPSARLTFGPGGPRGAGTRGPAVFAFELLHPARGVQHAVRAGPERRRRLGFGKSGSHSHKRTNRRWDPNIERKTYYLPSEDRRVTLTVSAKASRSSTATASTRSWPGCAARGSRSDGAQRDSPHRQAAFDRGRCAACRTARRIEGGGASRIGRGAAGWTESSAARTETAELYAALQRLPRDASPVGLPDRDATDGRRRADICGNLDFPEYACATWPTAESCPVGTNRVVTTRIS